MSKSHPGGSRTIRRSSTKAPTLCLRCNQRIKRWRFARHTLRHGA